MLCTLHLSIFCIILTTILKDTMAQSVDSIPDGFVFVRDVEPSIIESLRYAINENFIGYPLFGYKPDSSAILTQKAAENLAKVQKYLLEKGYSLVIYDAYRPDKTVKQFGEWAKNEQSSEEKSKYYPFLQKSDLMRKAYLTPTSGHSRGSTVDLTIIELGKAVKPVDPQKRQLADGRVILYLDDGTVDMGSSFDLFDEVSHKTSALIREEHQSMRKLLQDAMEMQGFVVYEKEWWHFTLTNEPFPDTYFNFNVESRQQK